MDLEKRLTNEEALRLTKIYNDYNSFVKSVQVPHDPDQPEPGVFKKSFVFPAEWGEVTSRSDCISPWGRQCELLLLSKKGYVRRLKLGVNGYDD